MTDARRILQTILESRKYRAAQKWRGSCFESIKIVANTHVGDIGQDFVEALCGELRLACEFPVSGTGGRARQSPWDMKIEGVTFEVKTATEDVNGAFQFNHIRHHRAYEALLCVGIAPNDIYFGAWTKADVSTEEAGHLVTMDKGSSATFKLSKRKDDLRPIDEFEKHIPLFLKRIK